MDKKKKLKALPAPDVYDVSAVKKKKKRIEEDDDDEPVKKKKKKRVEEDEEESRELAVAEPPKLSKLKGKALRTQFGSGTEKILRLLEQDETDPAIALIYKRLLQSVVDVLPLAEMGIRSSKGVRGVHGFNMLISSLRELMVDVQQAQDRGMMGEMLVSKVIWPELGDLAQETVREFSIIASDAKATMTAEEYEKFAPMLRESRDRLANSMTKHFRKMREDTINYLQG